MIETEKSLKLAIISFYKAGRWEMTFYFIVYVFLIHITVSPDLSELGQYIGREREPILGGSAGASVPGQCPSEISHAKRSQKLI